MAGTGDVSANSSLRRPALNERILSSMSRRSVAAHPWHDLEIGHELSSKFVFPFLYTLLVEHLFLFHHFFLS